MSFCIPGGPLFGQPSVVAKNVTINNGATGFMGSLFEGMAYGMGATSNIGMCGGCYPGVGLTGLGMPMGYPMMSQLTMPNLTSSMALLNNRASAASQTTTQSQTDNKLNNLTHFFSKCKIVPEGDGKYSAMSQNGTLVRGDYEQVLKGLAEAEAEYNSSKENGDKQKTGKA